MFFNKIDEVLYRFFLGDVDTHRGMPDVKVDFSGGAAYITEVGIAHLARAVDDAAHDGNFDALQVTGCCANFLCSFADVVQSASAGGAGDVFRLAETYASGL